jgi:hypothetical protein
MPTRIGGGGAEPTEPMNDKNREREHDVELASQGLSPNEIGWCGYP